jgi:hypothetical protein
MVRAANWGLEVHVGRGTPVAAVAASGIQLLQAGQSTSRLPPPFGLKNPSEILPEASLLVLDDADSPPIQQSSSDFRLLLLAKISRNGFSEKTPSSKQESPVSCRGARQVLICREHRKE